MENIRDKALDDEAFLNTYGSLRTGVPSNAYKEGWDRIFGSAGKERTLLTADLSKPNLKEK